MEHSLSHFVDCHFLLFCQGAYFMSPAARGFDALGLVKQINEQSADALEEAHEVLASGSVKNQHKGNWDKESTETTSWKKELIISKLPSEVMVCRLPITLRAPISLSCYIHKFIAHKYRPGKFFLLFFMYITLYLFRSNP
jgi:hypothetical protein